jgi:hypothetical protein
VTLDFGFWDFVLFSVIRVVSGYRISANENHKTQLTDPDRHKPDSQV